MLDEVRGFAGFLGLAEIVKEPDDRLGRRFRVIRRLLLGDAVRFR